MLTTTVVLAVAADQPNIMRRHDGGSLEDVTLTHRGLRRVSPHGIDRLGLSARNLQFLRCHRISFPDDS